MEPDRQGQCPKGQHPKGQNPQQASTDGPIHAGQCSAISLHETPLQDLLLSQQTPIELIQPSQAPLEGGQNFFFQQGDFLFPIGNLNPGAQKRQSLTPPQDFLHGMEGGLQQQKGILLGPAGERWGTRV